MVLQYIYILCVAACVDSISEVPHITVSAQVGSTVVLPCSLTHFSSQSSVVRWCTNKCTTHEFVFEGSSDGVYEGKGYEGRVDVPLDELRKGNCSLVLRNVRLTDGDDYRSFVMEHVDITDQNRKHEIVSVTLSVYGIPVSAHVGSTVVLPCELRDLSIKTPHVQWNIDPEIVFERKGKETYPGEGYEGRVDVPEDELLKGNCSLVLKNVSVSDEAVYSGLVLVKDTKKSVLVQKLQLSVYNEPHSDKKLDSSGTSMRNRHHYLNLVYLVIFCLICYAL